MWLQAYVDVTSFQRHDEEVLCFMSGSLNILGDVHYTDITYVVYLYAGERVTVCDRNLHQHFPHGATEIVPEA